MHRRIGSEASVPYEVHLGWMPHFEFEAFFEPDCAAHAARTASQMPVKPDMISFWIFKQQRQFFTQCFLLAASSLSSLRPSWAHQPYKHQLWRLLKLEIRTCQQQLLHLQAYPKLCEVSMASIRGREQWPPLSGCARRAEARKASKKTTICLFCAGSLQRF